MGLTLAQVAFGGDPEAALIQYTKNEEARRAISSIEAVLNNRFICVYWHREPGITSVPQQQEQSSGGQAATSSLSPAAQHSNMHMVSSATSRFCLFRKSFLTLYSAFSFYLQGIRQHNPAAYVLNKTGPKHRSPVASANVSTTKSDSLDSPTEPVTVRFTLSVNIILFFA